MSLSHPLHGTNLWLGIIPRSKLSRDRFLWTGSYRLLPRSPSPTSLPVCTREGPPAEIQNENSASSRYAQLTESMVTQALRAHRGVICRCAFLWRLLLLLTLCFALLESCSAVSKRSEAFVGYMEKSTQSSLCSDKMDSDICASYKSSGMCKTGEKATCNSKETSISPL